MRTPRSVVAAFALALLSVAMALPACVTTQNPTPRDQGTVKDVNCGAELLQDGISSAIPRVESVVAAGGDKTVVQKNLLGIVADLTAPAVACAMQYLTSKLGFDARAAESPALKAEYSRRVNVLRAFIDDQGWTFAGGATLPPPPS